MQSNACVISVVYFKCLMSCFTQLRCGRS